MASIDNPSKSGIDQDDVSNLFPPELHPQSPSRKVMYLEYNGDSSISLYQHGKDIRLPTVQYCPYGGFNRLAGWLVDRLVDRMMLTKSREKVTLAIFSLCMCVSLRRICSGPSSGSSRLWCHRIMATKSSEMFYASLKAWSNSIHPGWKSGDVVVSSLFSFLIL